MFGLWCEWRSLELASDLDDSDCRLAGGVRTVPLGLLWVTCDEGRGETGSSKVARVGRVASLKDFLNVFLSTGRLGRASSREISVERRNLAARPMREGLFLGPLKSFVGAVVMISGGRGTGGGFSACCLARRDSWESEALRNLRTEKRRCLFVSSWIGGESGRLTEESRVVCRATG